MNQSNKYVLISSVTLADDLADYLVEVCDFKCFRIHIKNPKFMSELFILIDSIICICSIKSSTTRIMAFINKPNEH